MAGPSALFARWRSFLPAAVDEIPWIARRDIAAWPACPGRSLGPGRTRSRIWATRRDARLWSGRRLLLSWPEPKAEYAAARTVGIGQARRWCTLSELSRLKQSKFTI